MGGDEGLVTYAADEWYAQWRAGDPSSRVHGLDVNMNTLAGEGWEIFSVTADRTSEAGTVLCYRLFCRRAS
jgi:hypothetical protein